MKRYNYQTNIFTQVNATSYYLLGCYLTDGSVDKYHTFEITSKDKDWLEIIRNLIIPEKPIEKQNNCWRLRGYNPIISEWLKYNNCIPNKSLVMWLPPVPKQYLSDTIRGLIDGDGSIDPTKNTVYLCSASKLFTDQFIRILEEQQIKHKLYVRNNADKHTLYRISIYGKNTYKFLKWIYYSDNVLCMPRKYKLAKSITSTFEKRGLTISNIDTFDTNKNRNSNKFKITNQDLLSLLETWNALPEQDKNKWGYKKQFYQKYVAGKYDINYHYFNRLLNGKQRTNITK
jgi:hypothetical protein